MKVTRVSRRQLLSSASLAAGASVFGEFSEAIHGSPKQEKDDSRADRQGQSSMPKGSTANDWRYVTLDSAKVAAEAYRLVPQGGCMYGLFAGVIETMAQLHGEPYRSFPIHMMKYGVGGVGLWGSLCGTLNGGAAIIGLFVPQKEQRERLIGELLSWYEATDLPTYRPKNANESPPVPTSIARSVLCHVSAGRWCAASGEEIGGPEMNERCRRLTAEVGAKTVELLNGYLRGQCRFVGPSAEVKSCLSCHGKIEMRDTIGQMQCTVCHQRLSEKHPSIAAAPSEAGPIHQETGNNAR